ncbi:MAG TPA: DUF4388 domain-containing protein [candidate division Zixibacteria bacterium]|nr:DUF4388 domain-containing protein [candidate division Zixibacteria bacterium]MDD4918323.1 DUF4388 domain-containing protein [candidate division Zixibacteria bacterium]HPM38342.1 DUF4388 domain-containing protein [candidate division Zixibacteria bacterium]
MSPSPKKRLDEILVAEGLASDTQIREALMRQKARGGKLGSHLLYHRYVDEAGLVKALAIQFACEGVVLANLDIPDSILELIPKKIALARRVLPVAFDGATQTVTVACEDPTDAALQRELQFALGGRPVKLCVAAELALDVAIARCYLKQSRSLEESLALAIPDAATDTGPIAVPAAAGNGPAPSDREAILLVTDEEYCGPLLQAIFERDNFDVTTTDSADDAIEAIGNRRFHSVFIKDTVPGDYLDLIDRLRKISPRTRVRYYESAARLLLVDDLFTTEGDLLVKNLDLFTAMMSTQARQPDNHSGRVGHYADRLCRRLGLPDKDRLQIVSAAYLHDLARFHYTPSETRDTRTTIKLTTRLLQSLNYPPVVVEMLRKMYVDLKGKYTKRLPIEALGGNILTIVDLYCENVAANERLLLDKFDAIKKKFRDLTGRLFMAEVAEAFIGLIQEELLAQQTSLQVAQVMLLSDRPGSLTPAYLRLRNEGFRTMAPAGLDSFVDLYRRSRPDIIVLAVSGSAEDVVAFIERLRQRDVDFDHTPAFALVDSAVVPSLTGLLEKGIEDILPVDAGLDLLVVKMQKIQAVLQAKQKQRETADHKSGATGRLADMNLIDLLQALGPSRRTARITVTPGPSAARADDSRPGLEPDPRGGFSDNSRAGRSGDAASAGSTPGRPDRRPDQKDRRLNDHLILYLDRGAIVFAQYRDKIGAEAVYETIGWADGYWSVEPVSREALPAPNNDLSNESILMEGCRLLDERLHAGKLF